MRQLRFEIEEQKAQHWLTRLAQSGKNKDDEKEEAERLIGIWSGAHLVQVEIRERRLRHGLQVVEHERPRWYTAMRKKEITEREAARLDANAHEYFQCRLEQLAIQREIAEDRAKHNPMVDYSGLIKRIMTGDARPAEIVSGSPWAMAQAVEVSLQNPGEQNAYWAHLERMNSAAALGMTRGTRQTTGAVPWR